MIRIVRHGVRQLGCRIWNGAYRMDGSSWRTSGCGRVEGGDRMYVICTWMYVRPVCMYSGSTGQDSQCPFDYLALPKAVKGVQGLRGGHLWDLRLGGSHPPVSTHLAATNEQPTGC